MSKQKLADNIGVIYARFSSDNQRDESIDAQLRAIYEYAARKGISIVREYIDRARSATTDDRPAFQDMIKDSASCQFSIVIVHKLDRFARNRFDSSHYKRILRKNGVKLQSVLENLDDSPESIITESVLEGMAEYYSRNLAREALKGMKETAHQCKHTGGTPPLGYDVISTDPLKPNVKEYVINEQEARTIRTIFEKYADGMGYKVLLKYLNDRGYKTKRGNAFGANSLSTILHNEKYVGTFIFNKKQEKFDMSAKRNPKIKPRDEWVIVENGMPAIIEKELFDKAQARLMKNKKIGATHKAKEIYLLSGLLFCGECGASMSGNARCCGRNKTRYVSYRCLKRDNSTCENKELRREYLESYVLDQLYNELFTDKSIKMLSKKLTEYNKAKATESNEELNQAKNELSDIVDKIGKIVHLVSESGIQISTVSEQIKTHETRKMALETYINEMTLNNNASIINEDMIYNLIDASREFVRTKNISECKNFIQSYVEKVIVYHERVEVLFKIHVPSDDGEVEPLMSGEKIKVLQRQYR